MNRTFLICSIILSLVSCRQADNKTAVVKVKNEANAVDTDARSIEQAADEAAKLVEAESVAEIREEKRDSANPADQR
jgi:hypothetical protein